MAPPSSALVWRAHYALNTTRSHFINLRDRWRDPNAAQLFRVLGAGGYDPDAHIDVLPQERLVYVCVPKCASTTIKTALAAVAGRSVPPHRLHARRHTGRAAPCRHVHVLSAGHKSRHVALFVRAQSLCAAVLGLGRQIPRQAAGARRLVHRTIFEVPARRRSSQAFLSAAARWMARRMRT